MQQLGDALEKAPQDVACLGKSRQDVANILAAENVLGHQDKVIAAFQQPQRFDQPRDIYNQAFIAGCEAVRSAMPVTAAPGVRTRVTLRRRDTRGALHHITADQ